MHIERNQIIFIKIYTDNNNNSNKNKFCTLSNNYTHARLDDLFILSSINIIIFLESV